MRRSRWRMEVETKVESLRRGCIREEEIQPAERERETEA